MLQSIIVQNNLIEESQLKIFDSISDHEGYILLRDQFKISEEYLLQLLSSKLKYSYKSIKHIYFDPNLITNFDINHLRQHRFIPVYEDEQTFCLATDLPFNPLISLKDLKKKITKILITSQDFNQHLQIKIPNNNFSKLDSDKNKLTTSKAFSQNQGAFHSSFKLNTDTLLDKILHQAFLKNASDIHFHQTSTFMHIKFRIDGKLHPYLLIESSDDIQRLITQIKIHGKMDISLINIPQDGRIDYDNHNLKFDIRVSSLPTVHGEDFVMRLFNIGDLSFNLKELGFAPKALNMIYKMLQEPSGLILVTGATGSGKTTTLYSMLQELKKNQSNNIITLEDPVEYTLSGIRQSQVNYGINYNFTAGLKAILRQDPDIIMIGEIRDQETAKIALDSAYTGHLVISSLHTSDIRSTILRLTSFQLDSYLITNCLTGIISQKLVPQKCPYCKDDFTFRSCKYCNSTKEYQRTIISEVLYIASDTSIKDLDLLLTSDNFYSFQEDIRFKKDQNIIN